MCDFSVIIRFGFRSLCDNGIRSRLVPFHFGWRVLSCCPWGKRFLDCVWVRLLPWGQETTCKRGPIWRTLCYPWGREKLWGYGWGCCPWAKSLHTKKDNIMPVVNGWISRLVYVVVWYICDKLPHVRFYGFGNYIVGAHKL